LDAIGNEWRKRVVDARRGRDALRDELRACELQHFLDECTCVDQLCVRLAALQERAQSVDHLGGASVFTDDIGKNFAQLIDVERVPLDEVSRRLGWDS